MGTITTNDGVQLYYDKWGSQGQPLILIHGWSGSHKYFQRNIKLLEKHFRVIAYDQRFHGLSDKPTHGFHVSRLAADLNDLITSLGLQDVNLLGTSMGCAVIWSYIELYGEAKLARAVFVDQAPMQNRAKDWELGSKGCYDAASLEALQGTLIRSMDDFSNGNVACCATLPIPQAITTELHAETLRCDAHHLGNVMADHTQLDWRPLLPRISLPCLNIIGEKSGVFPPQGCKAVSDLIPDCKTAYFSNANHWLYLEAPDEFNAIVSAFLLGQGFEAIPGVSFEAPGNA